LKVCQSVGFLLFYRPTQQTKNMNTIPNIKLVDDKFEGKISLPIWKDFQNKQGAYGSLDESRISNGEFGISIGGDMVVDYPMIKIEHINAYDYLTIHSEQVQNSILTRLLTDYKNLQTEYGYDEYEAKEFMPDVGKIEQFKRLIGLSQIHIMEISKDNIAYVGYEFGCSWDDEHGIGFMTHKDRIIEFGGADTSFLTWVAKKDLKPKPE
jgi:hypothetical protein